jgi:hypothetical protein
MTQTELTDDEAELIDSIRLTKSQRGLKRLPRKGEYGKLEVEWSNGVIHVNVNFSSLIK